MSFYICDDCKGDQFVDCHGEWTCTTCGLVKISGLLDERAEWISYSDTQHWRECHDDRMTMLQHYIHDKGSIDKLRRYMVDIFAFDSVLMDKATEYYQKTQSTTFKRSQQKAVMVTCIYLASQYLKRGIKIEDLVHPLGTKRVCVWRVIDDILHEWGNSCDFDKQEIQQLVAMTRDSSDKIARVLYKSNLVPQKNLWKVLQSSKKLYNNLKSYPHLKTIKSHTMIVTCIYIGCMMNGVCLDKNKFCEEFSISLSNLQHQETVVQEFLTQS